MMQNAHAIDWEFLQYVSAYWISACELMCLCDFVEKGKRPKWNIRRVMQCICRYHMLKTPTDARNELCQYKSSTIRVHTAIRCMHKQQRLNRFLFISLQFCAFDGIGRSEFMFVCRRHCACVCAVCISSARNRYFIHILNMHTKMLKYRFYSMLAFFI